MSDDDRRGIKHLDCGGDLVEVIAHPGSSLTYSLCATAPPRQVDGKDVELRIGEPGGEP